MLRKDGQQLEQLRLSRGTAVRIVAFNVNAATATERLPRPVRAALTELEALEVANERYPHHSLTVMPATHRPGMMSGMMLHPVGLPAEARTPIEVTRKATT